MKVKILGQFDYISGIDIEGKEIGDIEITEQEFKDIKAKNKCFDVEKQCVINYIPETINKIAELKNNLINTDYEAIKYAEGRMTGADYAPIGEQRQAYRDEINELEKQL